VEGYSGGTVFGESKSRDGFLTALMTGLAAADPMLYQVWLVRSHQPESMAYRFNLPEILASFPTYYSKRGEAKAEGIDQKKVKERMMALFLEHLKGDGTLFTLDEVSWKRYKQYEFIHYEGLNAGDMKEGTGGFKIRLVDREGNISYMWMRGSKTEPKFRFMADSKDEKEAEALLTLMKDLFSRAVQEARARDGGRSEAQDGGRRGEVDRSMRDLELLARAKGWSKPQYTMRKVRAKSGLIFYAIASVESDGKRQSSQETSALGTLRAKRRAAADLLSKARRFPPSREMAETLRLIRYDYEGELLALAQANGWPMPLYEFDFIQKGRSGFPVFLTEASLEIDGAKYSSGSSGGNYRRDSSQRAAYRLYQKVLPLLKVKVPYNSKGELNNLAQERGWPLPQYTVTQEGPEGNPTFIAVATLDRGDGNILQSDPKKGTTDKEAERRAAQDLLNKLRVATSRDGGGRMGTSKRVLESVDDSDGELAQIARKMRRQGYTTRLINSSIGPHSERIRSIEREVIERLPFSEEDKPVPLWYDSIGESKNVQPSFVTEVLVGELLSNRKHAVNEAGEPRDLLLAFRTFSQDNEPFIEILARNLYGSIDDILLASQSGYTRLGDESAGLGLTTIIMDVLGIFNGEVRIESQGRGRRFVNRTRRPIRGTKRYQRILRESERFKSDITTGTQITVLIPMKPWSAATSRDGGEKEDFEEKDLILTAFELFAPQFDHYDPFLEVVAVEFGTTVNDLAQKLKQQGLGKDDFVRFSPKARAYAERMTQENASETQPTSNGPALPTLKVFVDYYQLLGLSFKDNPRGSVIHNAFDAKLENLRRHHRADPKRVRQVETALNILLNKHPNITREQYDALYRQYYGLDTTSKDGGDKVNRFAPLEELRYVPLVGQSI